MEIVATDFGSDTCAGSKRIRSVKRFQETKIRGIDGRTKTRREWTLVLSIDSGWLPTLIEDWKLVERMAERENKSVDEIIKQLEELIKTMEGKGNNESESD